MKVTERRAPHDFAHCMRDLADFHYPDAERIRVVLDNLSTHASAVLYQALPPSRRDASLDAWSSITRPSMPVGSTVEIEIGVLRRQCLDCRIESRDGLVAEVAAWQHQRNASRAHINWMFLTEQVRVNGQSLPKAVGQRVTISVQRYY